MQDGLLRMLSDGFARDTGVGSHHVFCNDRVEKRSASMRDSVSESDISKYLQRHTLVPTHLI